MKTNRLTLLLTIALLFINHYKLIPQVASSQQSVAISRIQQRTQKLNKIISLSQDEIKILLIQDSIESRAGYPFRFGKNLDVDIDFIKEATKLPSFTEEKVLYGP